MPRHVVFVADFGDDFIEVSDRLPEDRPLPPPPGVTVPCFRGHRLTRLHVESDVPPILPEGDITAEEYRVWRATLGDHMEEPVNSLLRAVGLAGVCLDVRLYPERPESHGTLLEAEVTNVGQCPAGKVQVAWHGEWEPQGNDRLIGRGYHFRSVGPLPSQLLPGQCARLALVQPELRAAMSYAAALSPEKFYLAVSATAPGEGAFYEVKRIPGAELWREVGVLEALLAKSVRKE